MIRVKKVREPSSFHGTARKPGNAWLKANPAAKRPKDLWSRHLPVLDQGFRSLCGYAAMLDPTGGTVDHYLSFKNHPKLAYEWSNYRFASHSLNASKRTADASVLDPFEVKPGWFEIQLPSLQLLPTNKVPVAERSRAAYTLKRLKLRDGEKVIRWRQCWYEAYMNGLLTLEGLKRVAPLVAEAVAKANQRPKKKSSKTGRRGAIR